MFNVNGLASCAESQNCGSNNNGLRLMGRNAVPSIKDKKNQNFLHLAQKLKNTGNIPSVKSVDGKKVKAAKWSNDWSATETSAMLINQGGQPNADGSAICCDSSYSSQCQIQQQYSSGTKYYDFTNNRTRLEDPINGINVVDYVAHKDMLVVHNGTHDVCQKYCPIDPRDTMDAGRDIFLDSNATDLGKGIPSNDVEAIASFNRSMERATEQLNNLVYELEAYAPGLSRKKSIVVANKLDTLILPNEFNVDEHLAMLGSCVSDTQRVSLDFETRLMLI